MAFIFNWIYAMFSQNGFWKKLALLCREFVENRKGENITILDVQKFEHHRLFRNRYRNE